MIPLFSSQMADIMGECVNPSETPIILEELEKWQRYFDAAPEVAQKLRSFQTAADSLPDQDQGQDEGNNKAPQKTQPPSRRPSP